MKYNHILKIEEVYDLQKKFDQIAVNSVKFDKESQTTAGQLQLYTDDIVNVLSQMKEEVFLINKTDVCIAETQTQRIEYCEQETHANLTDEKVSASIEVQATAD